MKKTKKKTSVMPVRKRKTNPVIFIHLPAYREPELLPTIEDAIAQAKYPSKLRFGICRQFHPDDKFDNINKFRKDKRFRIVDIPHEQAKGLPYARAVINSLIKPTDDYILQLDAHHRFIKDWDVELVTMHRQLEKQGKKPILTGYLPQYNPFNDPAERTMVPWQQQFVCFYPHGTIFIRPGLLHGWETMTEPAPSRFLSGHFCFARTKWAQEIKHDPDIYFSGEELNLTIRSYTHGYDFFHPHKVVIWHATMREERSGKLIWDDQSKRGESWWLKQDSARAKIRQLLRTENNGFDLTGYDIGTVRNISDYEAYAGVNFKDRSVQEYTVNNQYPPNPIGEPHTKSFYHLVNLTRNELPGKDYTSILVAFDDEYGQGIHSRTISGDELRRFMDGTPIHYEAYFIATRVPKRLVFWAHSMTGGWKERVEHKL